MRLATRLMVKTASTEKQLRRRARNERYCKKRAASETANERALRLARNAERTHKRRWSRSRKWEYSFAVNAQFRHLFRDVSRKVAVDAQGNVMATELRTKKQVEQLVLCLGLTGAVKAFIQRHNAQNKRNYDPSKIVAFLQDHDIEIAGDRPVFCHRSTDNAVHVLAGMRPTKISWRQRLLRSDPDNAWIGDARLANAEVAVMAPVWIPAEELPSVPEAGIGCRAPYDAVAEIFCRYPYRPHSHRSAAGGAALA